jgi:hypothetical protein
MTMPTVSMCKAVCGTCEREFPYPSLGDFAYGEFILHSNDGSTFRHLYAINNEVWDYAAARVPPMQNVPVRESGGLLQEVVARLADDTEGRGFTMKMVCPHCRSHHFRDWGRERISVEEIPDATFQSFTSLDDEARENLLDKLEKEIVAETRK